MSKLEVNLSKVHDLTDDIKELIDVYFNFEDKNIELNYSQAQFDLLTFFLDEFAELLLKAVNIQNNKERTKIE